MTYKFFLCAIALMSLTGCQVADQFRGTGEATVIAVVQDQQSCTITFTVPDKAQYYISVVGPGSSVLFECRRLQPGMTIPVVVNPLYGDYPYVALGGVKPKWYGSDRSG